MRFARTAMGLMLALVGLVVSIAGAVAAFWLVGPDDTVRTGDHRLAGAGVAVVTAPGLLNRHGPVLHVTAAGDGRPVFVGVGRELDVSSYLAGSAHDRVVRIGLPVALDEQEVLGRTAKLTAPEKLDWWVARAAGNESQSIRWPMADGRYSVVVMNADGSPAVDAKVDFGLELAGAFGLGLVVLGLGLVALAGGCALAFSRRNQPEPVPVRVTAPEAVGPAPLVHTPAPTPEPAVITQLTEQDPLAARESTPAALERTRRAAATNSTSASTTRTPAAPAASTRTPTTPLLAPAASRTAATPLLASAAQVAATAAPLRASRGPVTPTPKALPLSESGQPETAKREPSRAAETAEREPVRAAKPAERESAPAAEPAIRYHPASRYLLTAHQNLADQQQTSGGLLLKERKPASADDDTQEQPPVEPVSESEYQAQLRKTAALLASGAVLLSATGCVATAEPNTERPDARPAITLADGLALVRKYNEITTKANATRDAQLSATVQADPTLAQTRAGFRVRRVLDNQPEPFTSTEPQIGAPDFTGYPMRFVVSAGVSGAPDTRQLAVWERRDAGASWVLTHSVYPRSTAKLPPMQGLQVPTDSDLADLTVRPGVAADNLAAYLTGGAKSPHAKKFAPSPGAVELLAERTRSAAADTAEAYIAGVTDTFTVSGEPVSFITEKGEALVFLALSERYLQRVEPGTSAYWTTGAATAFSNRIKYVKSLHQDYLHQVALVIPTRHEPGPVRVLSIDGQLVNAGGT